MTSAIRKPRAEPSAGPGLTRRQLLKGAAAAVAVSAAPRRSWGRPDPDYDCIVLGAGMAGVTAARNLHREGHRVLLIEGSGRIGGRMYTLRDFVRHPDFVGAAADHPVEAGAEYVHVGSSERYRAFYDELEVHGFGTAALPKFSKNRLAFPLSWKKHKDLLGALLCDHDLWPATGLLNEIEHFDGVEDQSVGGYLSAKGFKHNGIHLGRYTLSSHTPGTLYDPRLDLCRLGAGDAAPVDDLSVAGIMADKLPDQLIDELKEYRLTWKADDARGFPGYDRLPQAISEQVGSPSRILLGAEVRRVERIADGVAVNVVTSDGAARRFTGRAAVCTFSAGMLDPVDGAGESIFGPLLTAAKRRALESVEMGPITKFSLEFRRSYWGKKSAFSVLSNPTGCARTLFSAFPGQADGPFVLTALMMSRDHRLVSEIDDDARAVDYLLREIQRVFDGDGDPWRPEEVLVGDGSGASFAPNYHRQDWSEDRFARGGNSYIRYRAEVDSGAVFGLRETLKDPRATLPLFWAGEATAPAYNRDYQPLSVHGAYASGVGVAEDVDFYLGLSEPQIDTREQSFRSYYQAKYFGEPVADELEAEEAEEPTIAVRLTAKQCARLRRYARETSGGDAQEALHQLVSVGLFLHRTRPQKLKSVVKNAEHRFDLSLSAAELQRVRRYAAPDVGGNAEAAVQALVVRALEELPDGSASDAC